MIGSERMTAYINSLDQGYPAYLEQIERAAQEASIPITPELSAQAVELKDMMGRFRLSDEEEGCETEEDQEMEEIEEEAKA